MALRCHVQIVLVLLSQGITNELIVCGAPRVGHSLHQVSAKTSLKAFDLLFFCVNKTWGITRQIIEACIYSVRVLVPCVSHMNSTAFMRISFGGM